MLKINCVGDISLDNIDLDSFVIDDKLKEELTNADLNLANLESPLTNSNRKKRGQPWYLKAKPVNSEILNLFQVFTLANNHILDYQEEGLIETQKFLTKINKKWFGVGKNIEESFIPLCIEKNKIRIACLGFTHFYNAEKNEMGTMPKNYKKLQRVIKKYKKRNYFIMLFPHWNYEHVDFPAPLERKKERKKEST